ncbi:uncharacterized protein LOC117379863 [Periophthalmus magnuspinnatus]|uniref:uncharacterized protein LOC117379863 n=1 Tax=Periophthalmus magnuspinnatus TaxID=409849 RepID=UPI00145A89E7|nr:uncharacterized protein LOC117379863 [Periophthalmus magnuspinnatus]
MSPMFVGIGTGWRPAVRHWTRSSFTGKQLRVCIPPESPNKELVLVIGDSHLRSFVERDVDIRADGPYSFGYICSPGATSDTLETDVRHSTVDQRVSKCVVLATGNDSSTRGQTVERAQKNFQSLLSTTCVVDFPARHVVSVAKQNQFREAYQAAAEAEGLQYVFCVDSFPMKNLRLWAKDGIHLSVPEGMRVLSDLICKAIRELSESTVDSAHPSPKTPAAPCVKPLPKTPDVVVTCPTSRAVRVPSTTPQTDSEGWEFGKKSLQLTATTRNVSLRQVTGLCAIPVSAGRFAVLSAPQKTPATSKNPTTLATKKVSQARTAVPSRSQPKRQMKHAARVGEAASSTSSWQPRVVLKKLETTVAEAPVRPAINTAPTEDQQVQTDAVTVTLRPSTCTEPEVVVEVVKPDVKRPRRTSSPVHREADVQEEPDVKRPRRTPSPVHREADMQVPMKKVCCGKQVPVSRLQRPSPEECKAKVAKKDSCHEKQASVQLQPLQHEDSKAPQFDNIVGSFHQGHTIFHPQSRGKQCMAIALAAIVKHTHVREVHEWSQKDLNMVLLEGDRLYIRKKHRIPGDQSYLGAFDFKKEEKLFGKTFCLKMVTVIGRLLSATNPVEKVCFVTLKTALEEHLATDNACLFTMSGTTCAIIAKNGMYAIVDSHARSKSGMVDGNGSSVVVFFQRISEVYDHIIQLAAGFIDSNVEFELNSVAVTLKDCDCDGVTAEPTLGCPEPHAVTELKSNPNSCVTESTAATDTAGLKACDPGFKTKENLPEVGHKCGRTQMKSPLHKKRYRVDTELKSGSPIVKKAKLHDANDITIVGHEENALQFNPLSEKVCKAICKFLHVEFENCNVKESLCAGDAGVPCHNEKIVADGNCFFRAISQAISGTQKHHRRIRLNAVKHLEKNPEKYHCLLNEEHQHLTVAEYIKLQKMCYVNTWATQTEIQATADCIGVDIYTFYQGKWLRFQNSAKQQSAEGIYLQNHGAHYEHVVCVKQAAVVPYKQKNYKNKAAQVTAETCVSDEYLHECTSECNAPCPLQESRGELWMCKVCHSKIRRGVTPAEWWGNNLQLDSIPLELACLNHLEKHLIALNIPFMKVLALPKGGQNGCHGPIFCVPSSVNHTCSVLPRSNLEGCLLRVKLKRKLSYKGHYEYHFVDTNHLKEALKYLKENNQYYQDIEINEEWVNEFAKEEENQAQDDSNGNAQNSSPEDAQDKTQHEEEKHTEEVSNNNSKQTESPDEEDETLHDRQNHCIYQDSCSMPVDLGQETLDQGFEDIINLAPAEGNNPVRILSDKDNEAKSFPYLFPSGNNTYHTPRQHYLTLARYFNNRILHADGRFAKCVEYIFFAQYMSEVQQVIQQVSIASRKGHTNPAGQKENAPENIESLQDIIKTDEGYRFLRPIRGTPSFWQGAQKDLLAMVRNLGKPTFFCSFSSADLRWGGLLNSILKQEGRTETSESLEYAERCELLRNRPVTAARMFDYRWHLLLNYVLLSSLNPIGKIKDYFYRVEFQQRGSPHVHALFWIEDAPEIGKNTDEEVVKFINKYITCEIPTQDQQLAETVTSVQQHSQRHSKTCKKKNTACRFNFPRPVSERTFITKKQKIPKCPKCQGDTATNSQEQKKDTAECICSQNEQNFMKEEDAMKILTTVKKALLDKDNPITSIQQLFQNVGITQEVWEKALKCVEKRMQIVLQRDVNEIWINPYNPILLKCWNANMDIQYVVDVYACIVYIISYMSKSEREMGLLLKQTHQEATKQGNADAKEAMKKIGQAYLHNRDVSAQEAVYRITQMHLKECSRKVVFIPTGDTIFKLTKPLNELKKSGNNDIWMTGFVDRYKNRPQNDTFDNMCIATFASEYRVLSTSEKKSKNVIKLQNSCGYISKRFRTKPAVVRYARFSETKNPELYYKSLLQLFFPYRHDNDLKPSSFHSFEQFYKEGTVQLGNQTVSVMSIVNSNRSHYDIETEDLEEIKNNLDSNEILEDAWAMLCPEQEAERLEASDELAQSKVDDEDPLPHIPDLGIANKETAHLEKQHNAMTRAEGLDLIRSLNDIQLSIFFKIQKWCVQKVNGNDPEPLHVFITGGAGTGKSHLIRAIQYEANRLFAPMRRHPDNMSVLITAPTGMAAYNLNASTIHSAFSIGTDVTLPYIPLGEEKLNSLRAKYIDVKLVIIDEISMVSHKLLTYIHGRLRQIKQRGDVSPFGNVSLIAVGDFYQLPPVMAKGLYTDNLPLNFWSSFKMAELKTIVRQKDTTFAELLNRLRTRSKGTPMLHEDIHILQSRETGEESSALHIFPTNSQVNEHNFNQLKATCPDYQTIDAQDYHYNRKTGKMESKVTPHSKDNLTSLQKQLFLGVPARVMLCKNIDVEDGLVNGVCGTVTHISETERNGLPEAVYVQFDDINVGTQRRKKYPSTAPALINSTRIQPEEERANSKGGKRRQFPLALAWAVTIHKVQGLTVDNAVVSLKQVFASGQSYVALSRVRSLDGLIIQDFDEKAIYCNDEVKHALEAMPCFLDDNVSQAKQSADVLTLFLMNVQGLVKHVPDLVSSMQHLQPDCIAVTETWLTSQSALHSVDIDGYSFHSRPRSLAYEHSKHPALTTLKSQHHGGVGMYCSNNTNYHFPDVPQFNLECLIYKNVNHQVLVAVVYRPPTYPMSVFKQNLKKLLTWLQAQSQSIVVMGDFNDDILKSSSVCNFMSSYGYVQNVTSPTTERGTLIDHVYVKSEQYEISSEVVPTYFSDHQGIACSLKMKSV